MTRASEGKLTARPIPIVSRPDSPSPSSKLHCVKERKARPSQLSVVFVELRRPLRYGSPAPAIAIKIRKRGDRRVKDWNVWQRVEMPKMARKVALIAIEGVYP